MNTHAVSILHAPIPSKEHTFSNLWRRPRIVEVDASELIDCHEADHATGLRTRIALAAEWNHSYIGKAVLEIQHRTAVIRTLHVDAAWRDRGIGRRLLRSLLEQARLHLVSDVHVLATASDAGFYALNRFRPVHERTDDAHRATDAGADETGTLMVRHLTTGLVNTPFNGITVKL